MLFESGSVLFESGLIASVGQTLRGGDTGGWTARQAFGTDENSNRGLVIVLRHGVLLFLNPHEPC